jgi:NADH-quinone oxidoreductase subunit I
MEFIKKISSRIIAIKNGMEMIAKHAFRPAITIEYPEVKDEFNARLRGHIALTSNEDGSSKCIDCKSCVRVCPCGDLIKIKSHKDSEGKVIIDRFSIDLGRCIVCGNCVDICPKNALIMSNNYELAKYNKNDLIFEIEDLKLSYEETQHLLKELEKDL